MARRGNFPGGSWDCDNNMTQRNRETAMERQNDSMLNRVLQLIERSHRILGYDTGLTSDSDRPLRSLSAMPLAPSETQSSVVTALLSAGIRTFSGKWKLSILWYLRQRPRRFSELASLLPGVTSKVLTYQLRELVDAGLVSRKFTIAPRQTRYALTEAGIDAMPLLQLLYEWGHRCCAHSGDFSSLER